MVRCDGCGSWCHFKCISEKKLLLEDQESHSKCISEKKLLLEKQDFLCSTCTAKDRNDSDREAANNDQIHSTVLPSDTLDEITEIMKQDDEIVTSDMVETGPDVQQQYSVSDIQSKNGKDFK